MAGVSALSSVHRALQVLEVVAAAGDGISAKAVARRLEYNLSTTYHLLESLVADGYLVRLEAPRGCATGTRRPGRVRCTRRSATTTSWSSPTTTAPTTRCR